MNAKEKYENILNTMEQLIIENELSNRDISEKAFDSANMPMEDRSRNALFEFLMEKKVLQYITERRLMIGYKILVTEEDKKVAYKKALDISGSSDQAAFITKFKKVFNMTPLEARSLGDASLYQAVPSWEGISGYIEENHENMVETIFDVPRDQLKIVQEALNLQDFYSLNDKESEFAYSLFKNGIDMERAFEYLADYFARNNSEDRDTRLEEDLDREDVKYLYFECNYGFDDIFRILLMQFLKQFSRPIKFYDKGFLNCVLDYIDNGIWNIPVDFKTPFETKYDYYKEQATDVYTELDLKLYIFYTRVYEYKKAFSMIKPGLDDINELKRIMRIYGKQFEEDEVSSDEDYELIGYSEIEEEQDREPDAYWDDNLVPYSEEDEEDMDEDEDAWIPIVMEGPENDIVEDEVYNEDEFFDVDGFEKLCNEMSDQPSTTKVNEFSKRFRKHKDLDVKKFWNKVSRHDVPGIFFLVDI